MKKTINVTEPKDWPQNNREASLSNVCNYMKIFFENPSFSNKELVLALVTQDELNQSNDIGIMRVTDYEVALMNSIFSMAAATNFLEVKNYLYRMLTRVISQKKFFIFALNKTFEETFFKDSYMKLIPNLKFFYIIYAIYSCKKDMLFYKVLINFVKDEINKSNDNEYKYSIYYYYNLLLYDLSFDTSGFVTAFCKFTRRQLKSLFKLQARLANMFKENPIKRPLLGVISITYSNWILKSRTNYNYNYLYKCINDDNTLLSAKNNEIWLRKTEFLNDEYEGEVYSNLFSNDKSWIKYDFMKNAPLKSPRLSYVSSFTKKKPTYEMMKKYGKNFVGIKNDKIATSIAPIYINVNKKPFISQVMAFDITYSKDKFKKEINFLGDVINSFEISEKDKETLFNNIIPYWKYSIKNPKWRYERERRYEIMIFNEYNYIDTSIDKEFLKIKTYLMLAPDFINKDNINHDLIMANRLSKLKIETKPYLFCNDCLNNSFDAYVKKAHECPICKSKNITFFNNKNEK